MTPAKSPPPSVSQIAPELRAGGTRTVLVVDGDGVSRSYVEDALASAALQAESVRTFTAAMELLRAQRFDLVVVDTILPDGDGFALCEAIRREARHDGVPVVFYTADDRVASRVRAFKLGASDFITKPCIAAELSVRCFLVLDRARSDASRTSPSSSLGAAIRADLSVVPFADLVVMLEMSRQTGQLLVRSEGVIGRIWFDEGRVVHAQHQTLTGPDAFYRISWTSAGDFEFAAGPCTIPPQQRDIQESVTSLLIEGARQFDEAKTQRFPILPARRTSRPPPPGQVKIRRILRPTIASTRALLEWLDDPFSLGRLRYWKLDVLEKGAFLKPGHALALLLGAPGPVSTAVLEMAAPPDPDFLIEGLSAGPKVLGLELWVDDGVGFDLLVVDPSDPEPLPIKDIPALAIVAPENGEYRSLPVGMKVKIESVLCESEPMAVVGAGHDLLEPLGALGPIRRGATSAVVMPGALGREIDLRTLLKKGVELWRDMPTP